MGRHPFQGAIYVIGGLFMDLDNLLDRIPALAAVYSFEILPDGSFSEIRFSALNQANREYFAHGHPGVPAPEKGSRLRDYFTEVNFETFIYKCATTNEMLYSYVNAHGLWMKGFYIPLSDEGEVIKAKTVVKPSDKPRTLHCLYLLTQTRQPEAENLEQRSPAVANAIMNLSIKLHETQDFHLAMAAAAKEVKKVCDASRCCVYTVDRAKKQCSLFGEQGERRQFLEEFTGGMGRTPYETALAWEKDLAGSDCIMLDDLKAIEKIDPLWYKSLTDYKLNNIILYAIRHDNKIIGYIWVADFDSEKMMFIKETLEVTTFILAAVIANHQLMSSLEEMSTVDSLTQVNNRNAMNRRVDRIISGADKPAAIGVVMADLNGLKPINDEKGHDAGDKLLSNAAALLKIVFGDNEIYRIGGDEFMVFCPDALPGDLEIKIAQLKALADSTPDVSFAVGFECTDGDYNIRRVMQIADEKMYDDKEEYYRLHTDKDRRNKYTHVREKFSFS